MELTFERDDLLHALQVLQGVASGRNTLPILSNVLIHAEGDTIECIATDLEIGIKMKVEGAITEGGSITVSAKKLGDIVKELPSDKSIDLATTANDRLEIPVGTGFTKLSACLMKSSHNFLLLRAMPSVSVERHYAMSCKKRNSLPPQKKCDTS